MNPIHAHTPTRSTAVPPQGDRAVADQVGRDAHPKAPGSRGFGVYLAFCLIPGSAFCLPASKPGPQAGSSRPYLAVIGPPVLRFREAIEPQPDVSTRPPAGAPPHPSAGVSETIGSESRPEIRISPSDAAPVGPRPPVPAPPQAQPKVPDDSSQAGSPIIPDDSRPKVRPEDFLPYFQFPGSRGSSEDVSSPSVPMTPGQQPPSTATYRQQ